MESRVQGSNNREGARDRYCLQGHVSMPPEPHPECVYYLAGQRSQHSRSTATPGNTDSETTQPRKDEKVSSLQEVSIFIKF